MNISNLPNIWPRGLLIDPPPKELFRKEAVKPEPPDSKIVQPIKPIRWAKFQQKFKNNFSRKIDIKV